MRYTVFFIPPTSPGKPYSINSPGALTVVELNSHGSARPKAGEPGLGSRLQVAPQIFDWFAGN
ncbi:hypothetical protein [Moorena sp. SIO1G6]|uniref:hypothetical protein n=1 Tax=Moorena sp. SIO1G6 TaxID=2607840 RepID=UPI00257A86A7|nr:hypothetical protein [Moorena sp. SIO1G6]